MSFFCQPGRNVWRYGCGAKDGKAGSRIWKDLRVPRGKRQE